MSWKLASHPLPYIGDDCFRDSVRSASPLLQDAPTFLEGAIIEAVDKTPPARSTGTHTSRSKSRVKSSNALVKDFVGGEPSLGFAVRDFNWGSLRNSFSLAETEDQPTPVKLLSRYQQSRSQERMEKTGPTRLQWAGSGRPLARGSRRQLSIGAGRSTLTTSIARDCSHPVKAIEPPAVSSRPRL